MTTPPQDPRDLTLRQILDNAHQDIQISQLSSWRFSLSDGVDQFLPVATLYPYNESVVEDLKVSTAVRKRHLRMPYVSIVDAAQALSSANSIPRSNMGLEQNFALARLEGLQSKLHSDPDNQVFRGNIAFEIFEDLDIGLFEGMLTGNVFMRWYTQPDPRVPISRDSVGYTTRRVMNVPGVWHDGARIEIVLNAIYLLLDTRSSVQKIVEVLVHEMIHAYLVLLTNTWEDHQLHGPLFQQCLEAVNRTLQQHTGFSTGMESEWAPHGIYGVACPSCLTPFDVRLH